jgi:hypothetical protein
MGHDDAQHIGLADLGEAGGQRRPIASGNEVFHHAHPEIRGHGRVSGRLAIRLQVLARRGDEQDGGLKGHGHLPARLGKIVPLM